MPGLLGIFQLSYLIDAIAGVLSFAIVAALAPFIGPRLVGRDGTLLIVLYALTLLISTVDETSVSVLRLLDRFRLLAGEVVNQEDASPGLQASGNPVPKLLESLRRHMA